MGWGCQTNPRRSRSWVVQRVPLSTLRKVSKGSVSLERW